LRASDSDCTALPADGRSNCDGDVATVGLIVDSGAVVAGIVKTGTGGLDLGLGVNVGLGVSVGAGSGMRVAVGVLVGKAVGVGL